LEHSSVIKNSRFKKALFVTDRGVCRRGWGVFCDKGEHWNRFDKFVFFGRLQQVDVRRGDDCIFEHSPAKPQNTHTRAPTEFVKDTEY